MKYSAELRNAVVIKNDLSINEVTRALDSVKDEVMREYALGGVYNDLAKIVKNRLKLEPKYLMNIIMA